MSLERSQYDENRRTPFALRAAAEVNRFFNAKSPEIRGKEHLEEIPEGKRVILAVTHISDLDTSLAISALGNDFDLVVATQSTVLDSKQDRGGHAGVIAAGLDNFLEVDYYKTSKGASSGLFNPKNFSNMADAMNDGKDILIVAHNPSRVGTLTRGGYGAVYLSQIVKGTIILPVAVNVKSREQVEVGKNATKIFLKNAATLNRPDTEVIIGKPIEPKHIEGIERLNELLEKRKQRDSAGPPLGPEGAAERLEVENDAKEFHRLSQELRAQSKELMQALAAMLPEEKKGPYGDAKGPETTAGTSA